MRYLREEGVEAVVSASNSLVRGHAAIGRDSMLKAVELPASVTNLDTGLGIERIKLGVFTSKLCLCCARLHSALATRYIVLLGHSDSPHSKAGQALVRLGQLGGPWPFFIYNKTRHRHNAMPRLGAGSQVIKPSTRHFLIN